MKKRFFSVFAATALLSGQIDLIAHLAQRFGWVYTGEDTLVGAIFGGVIADCVDRGLAVQLCFMVEHFDIMGYPGKVRTQEMLSGLWEMGIRNYPIIGPFQDHFLKSLESAKEIFGENGIPFSVVNIAQIEEKKEEQQPQQANTEQNGEKQ